MLNFPTPERYIPDSSYCVVNGLRLLVRSDSDEETFATPYHDQRTQRGTIARTVLVNAPERLSDWTGQVYFATYEESEVAIKEINKAPRVTITGDIVGGGPVYAVGLILNRKPGPNAVHYICDYRFSQVPAA